MGLSHRIKKARTDAGMTQEGLAVAVGKTRGAVSQWESGEVRPRHETLKSIATATSVDLRWLESAVAETGSGLLVIGTVSAGVWREADLKIDPHPLPVAPDPRYPAEAQRMYRVEGTSLNKTVQDGSYIHTVDVLGGGVEPQHGNLVVVKQARHGLTEYTAKRYLIEGDKQILRPESDDPLWQDDLHLNGDEETEITICDVVIAKWESLI